MLLMRTFLALLTLFALALQPATAGSPPDTLGKIRKTGAITVAYSADSPPFSFAQDGEPAGYSVALCREILEGVEKQLGLKELKVTWTAANTPDRLAMVAKGKADLECGTTSITLDRQEQVDFSNEIFVEAGGVLTLRESGIKGLVSLADKKVAVIPDTTTERRLRRALERKRVSADLVAIESAAEGMMALSAGRVDAYAGDRLVLISQVAQAGEPERFALLTETFSIDPYGFALPRGDADFRLAVNRALAQVYRGAALEQIFVRWFGSDAEPTEVLRTTYLLNAYPD
jgi:ABC-type amino acid transport substrate-binding protein